MDSPTSDMEICALSFLEHYPRAPGMEIYGASGYMGRPDDVISSLQSKDMIAPSKKSGWELTRQGRMKLEDFYMKQSDMKTI
jgi:hypothetical protein